MKPGQVNKTAAWVGHFLLSDTLMLSKSSLRLPLCFKSNNNALNVYIDYVATRSSIESIVKEKKKKYPLHREYSDKKARKTYE